MQITLSPKAQELLYLAQKTTNQDENSVILNALESYIEDLEDYHSALEAEKRLLANSSCISVDELMQKANIDASEV